MEALLAAIITGLLLGMVYGLAAVGLNLIFGVLKIINLSHGAFIALGMFGAYYLFQYFGLIPFVSVIPVFVVILIIGILLYFIAIRRVMGRQELSTLLITYSISLIIVGLGTFFFTTNPRSIDIPWESIRIFSVYIPATRIVALFLAIICTFLLYLFLYKTWIGKAVRAVSMNRVAAEYMGVNSHVILATSFGIGIGIAAIAGVVIASIFPFTILSGGVYELKSFVICVLGGLGNPFGAIAGGLILGLVESVLSLKIPVGIVPFIEFILLVLMLLVKPEGIFGRR
ncbi:MAG: branched-chain amino acid ABC transporter permease [Thermosulfidibacteraceae bacterium]